MIFADKVGKDLRHPINYRPITLLEVPGKILERIINSRFVAYLEGNNLFNSQQYGFRKQRGTELAILKLYESIAISQQQRGRCMVICRDVEKAFDKVWIAGLQYKILNLDLI